MAKGAFAGIGEVEVTTRGIYLLPGSYDLEVENILTITTRKKTNAFIAEFRVLKSSNPEVAEGALVSWYQALELDAALPNIKKLFIALTGTNMADPKAKETFNGELEELLELMTSFVPGKDENGDERVHPAKELGWKVHVDCVMTETKAGGEFTVHNWSKFDE